MGGEPQAVGQSDVVGFAERVRMGAKITGWAWDPSGCRGDCSLKVAAFRTSDFTDQSYKNMMDWTFTSDPRPDVRQKLGFGGNTGFALKVDPDLIDGKPHKVWIAAQDNNTGVFRGLQRSPMSFTGHSPIGHLDPSARKQGWLVGWALDRDAPTKPVVIDIDFGFDDYAGCGTDTPEQRLANQPRVDVNRKLGVPGNHGFVFRSKRVAQRLNEVDGCIIVWARDVGGVGYSTRLATIYANGAPAR